MSRAEVCHICDWESIGPFDWWTRAIKAMATNPFKIPRKIYTAVTPRMYLAAIVGRGEKGACDFLKSVAKNNGHDLTPEQADSWNRTLANHLYRACGMDVPDLRVKWAAMLKCPKHGPEFGYKLKEIDRVVGSRYSATGR